MQPLAAFHIPALPPNRPLPVITIRTPTGTMIDELARLTAPSGPRGWDQLLTEMGYTRLDHWAESEDLDLGGGTPHVCRVVPAPVVGATGHAAAHLTAGLLPSCPATTVLSDQLARQLGGWEFGYRGGELIECDYGAMHRPPHVGLGQPDDDRDDVWVWLVWNGDQRMLSSSALCGIEGQPPGTGRPSDPCVLPVAHVQAAPAHSWQLAGFNPGARAVAPSGLRTAAAVRRRIRTRRPGEL